MEREVFLSGYCRCLDASRMVTVEIFAGGMEVDCSYEICPYAPNCQIGKKIQEITP